MHNTHQKNDEVTILLLGDDDAHAELLTSNLIRDGIGNDVVHYVSGQDGIAHLLKAKDKAGKFLVLLDLNPSDPDEDQVLSFIRRHQDLRNTPVIVLTTPDKTETARRRYGDDCQCYLEKPLSYSHFAQAIVQLGLYFNSSAMPATDLISVQHKDLSNR